MSLLCKTPGACRALPANARAPLAAVLLYSISTTASAASLYAEHRARTQNPEAAATAAELDTDSYQRQIETLETQHGAYAAGLAEPLLGLGLALQAQGRHEDALKLFKRGIHLARINDGLHSASQIPLLQGEITSHLARGNYASVDDRQRYLLRVQLRARAAGGALADVFMEQAEWQFKAYLLGVGDPGARLENMRALYVNALSDIMEREGEHSQSLASPLQHLLRTQYLIADYNPPAAPAAESQGWVKQLSQQQYSLSKSRNYSKGRAVISTLYNLEHQAAGDISVGSARTWVMLGDWHLYNNRHDAAHNAYNAALEELAALDAAQNKTDALLGRPVALPDIDELRPLSLAQQQQGDIMLQFTVSDSGRATDIARLDNNNALDGKARRLIKHLRRTKFRPRFEGGQPVETENLVYAVNVQELSK